MSGTRLTALTLPGNHVVNVEPDALTEPNLAWRLAIRDVLTDSAKWHVVPPRGQVLDGQPHLVILPFLHLNASKVDRHAKV
jgi:hypothetical protein